MLKLKIANYLLLLLLLVYVPSRRAVPGSYNIYNITTLAVCVMQTTG